MINISEIKVRPYERGKSNLKAFVDVLIDECLAINGIKIMDGKNGLWLSMPSVKGKNDKWNDIVYPINTDTRKYMTKEILKAYDNTLAKKEELFGDDK